MTNEELLQKIANGDTSAVQSLWAQVDRLFYLFSDKLYHRYRNYADSHGVALEDCRQICWFAFLDTVKDYNSRPNRELKFASFVRLHVKRRIFELLGLRTTRREPLDIDAPLSGAEGDVSIADTIADPAAEDAFAEIDGTDIADSVWAQVATLPPKQAAAIRCKFWQEKTFAEIGRESGVSTTQARNAYQHAIRKLHRDQRLQEIHDEYYSTANLTKHTSFRFFKESGMSSVEWHLLNLEERLERAKTNNKF
ncbi:MAG: sigma-70 family RNA polymerase sigma factor [Oscillospiraceae bacterium]|jgi:RNA polymerase sigma factor (sigma-70 family)|nr:sigma-70 family RNA polymerase sigma factor [Oscillospiraceae bacterium]